MAISWFFILDLCDRNCEKRTTVESNLRKLWFAGLRGKTVLIINYFFRSSLCQNVTVTFCNLVLGSTRTKRCQRREGRCRQWIWIRIPCECWRFDFAFLSDPDFNPFVIFYRNSNQYYFLCLRDHQAHQGPLGLPDLLFLLTDSEWVQTWYFPVVVHISVKMG